MRVADLDDPGRIAHLRATIRRKRALELWYLECYERYAECLGRCPEGGLALEIGAGASFAKEVLPEIVTSDLQPYAGVDRVIDATRLDLPPASVRALLMTNVFHHLPDVEAFLEGASRCLRPGGRILMIEPYPGWIATPLYRFAHHEPFDPDAASWSFESHGPLSSANGALPWIVFERDRARFERCFPGLALASYEPHTPLRYFLSGGLLRWNLLPGFAFGAATWLDRSLVRVSPRFGSFVTIELARRAARTDNGRLPGPSDPDPTRPA